MEIGVLWVRYVLLADAAAAVVAVGAERVATVKIHWVHSFDAAVVVAAAAVADGDAMHIGVRPQVS